MQVFDIPCFSKIVTFLGLEESLEVGVGALGGRQIDFTVWPRK